MTRKSSFMVILSLIMAVSLVFSINEVDASSNSISTSAATLNFSENEPDYENLSNSTRYISRYQLEWRGSDGNFVIPINIWYSDNYGWSGTLYKVDEEVYGFPHARVWIGYYSGYVTCYLETCHHQSSTKDIE